MADTQTTQLDPDSAYAVVHQRVYAPRFFEKLAASPYGIRPRDQAEALQLLTMATRLRQAYDAEQEKQAAAQGSFISNAASTLEAQLGQRGMPATDPAAQRFYKAAAVNGAKDAELANAILSLQLAGVQQSAA